MQSLIRLPIYAVFMPGPPNARLEILPRRLFPGTPRMSSQAKLPLSMPAAIFDVCFTSDSSSTTCTSPSGRTRINRLLAMQVRSPINGVDDRLYAPTGVDEKNTAIILAEMGEEHPSVGSNCYPVRVIASPFVDRGKYVSHPAIPLDIGITATTVSCNQSSVRKCKHAFGSSDS